MTWNSSQQSPVLGGKPLLLDLTGNVRCHPHLALGSLFEGTRDPQYVAVSFRLDCVQDSPRCSTLAASFSSAQDPVIGHPTSKSTADANSTSLYLWSCY